MSPTPEHRSSFDDKMPKQQQQLPKTIPSQPQPIKDDEASYDLVPVMKGTIDISGFRDDTISNLDMDYSAPDDLQEKWAQKVGKDYYNAITVNETNNNNKKENGSSKTSNNRRRPTCEIIKSAMGKEESGKGGEPSYHHQHANDNCDSDTTPPPSTEPEINQIDNTICNIDHARHAEEQAQHNQQQYQKFHHELSSLRDATRDAIQLSACQEQERLFFEAQEMTTRIAYLRKKISLARDEYLEKEGKEGLVEGGDNDDEHDELHTSLRKSMMSMVRELSRSSIEVDESDYDVFPGEDDADALKLLSDSTMKRIGESQSALNSSLSTKSTRPSSNVSGRASMRSSLHGSQLSKNTDISEATGVPQMSRGSLLGMFTTSQRWLDDHNDDGGQPNNNERFSRPSMRRMISNSSKNSDSDNENPRTSFRFSFMMGGDGDAMPSRWKAREKERAKTEKQKEEEEKRRREKELQEKKGESNKGKLSKLISLREGEISVLEKRTVAVVEETSTLRDEISLLETNEQNSRNEYEQERQKILTELKQVESDNERLDYMLIETGVILDEKKMNVDLLAAELKEAREDLRHVQNERDQQRRKLKWKRNRQLAADRPKPGEEDEDARYLPGGLIPSSQQQRGKLTRYTAPMDDVLDSDDDDLDNSQRSAGKSIMSALTTDDFGDMIDILDQLEI